MEEAGGGVRVVEEVDRRRRPVEELGGGVATCRCGGWVPTSVVRCGR
jgi:hypothetical protein